MKTREAYADFLRRNGQPDNIPVATLGGNKSTVTANAVPTANAQGTSAETLSNAEDVRMTEQVLAYLRAQAQRSVNSLADVQKLSGELRHARSLKNAQWAVAAGAAVLSETDARYRLQQGFGVLLSDDSFYPIFTAGQGVPCESSELRFGVVEDTRRANFVFADERGNILRRQVVPIKGFTAEGIHLNCHIDEDLILQ